MIIPGVTEIDAVGPTALGPITIHHKRDQPVEIQERVVDVWKSI